MHIITSDGKIFEGQELTAEEVDILQDLIESKINDAAHGYIPLRDSQAIGRYLIANFKITRRKPIEPEPPQVAPMEYPEVEAPAPASDLSL